MKNYLSFLFGNDKKQGDEQGQNHTEPSSLPTKEIQDTEQKHPAQGLEVIIPREPQKIPRKFKEDIEMLKSIFKAEFSTGLVITFNLRDALNIMYRDRERVDSYDSLVKFLDTEYGIELKIVSQKTKKRK